MTGHCGSLPLLYMQLIMAHTSSKSLVELSTDGHETTFMNVTQMLSSLTHIPRLKWLNKPSPLHQPQKLYSYSKHLLLLQYNHLLLPQHPSKLQPKALQQHPAPSAKHMQLQMFTHWLAELMSHLTDLVMSVRHHNALLSICKYQPRWCDRVSKCTCAQQIKI